MQVGLITTCSPFKGEKGVIQNITFANWQEQNVKVIVLGEDYGVKSMCSKYSYTQVKGIPTAKTVLGHNHHSIMLDSGLKQARRMNLCVPTNSIFK